MSSSIYSIITEAEVLLNLEPEELAGVVLEVLNSYPPNDTQHLHRGNFSNVSNFHQYPRQYQKEVAQAVMEAWGWLERESLIAYRPGGEGEWVFITRRGKKIKKASDLESYRKGNLLPPKLLHPEIANKVWANFIRGEYDTAVFQAFKEVEVATRTAGGFKAEDFGVPLMRRAFDPQNGPLTDQTLPPGEREALANLFAGAIGSYKNPHSHRKVDIEATEAVEMIILASHLLNIIDSRSSVNDKPAEES